MSEEKAKSDDVFLLDDLVNVIADLRNYLVSQNYLGVDYYGPIDNSIWLPPKIPVIMDESRKIPESGHSKAELLEKLRRKIGNCHRCRLGNTRTKLVFGEGNPDAKIVFVGEGPGRDEDIQGRPFVGAAGGLLENMIKAMGLSRKDVYIGNIIKCRPPGNRNPADDEIKACFPFLEEQLSIISPKVICALGKFAAQTLLNTKVPISRLRGKVNTYMPSIASGEKLSIPVVSTYHPAYLLRNPGQKKVVWEDLKLVMELAGMIKK